MTPYGIDRTHLTANRPHRARLRWIGARALDLLIVTITLTGLLVLINIIEGITL